MSIQSLFERQIEAIRDFMDLPNKSLLAVQYDEDGEELLRRVLVRLEGDDDDPNVMLAIDLPFTDEISYFTAALDELHQKNEAFRDELAEVGVELPVLPDGPASAALRRFESYASAVAESLPDAIGSYVVVLDPDSVADADRYRESMVRLADATDSPWAKFIVLDPMERAHLTGLDEEAKLADVHVFRVGSDDIEREIEAALQAPDDLTPVEVRQYTAILAGFAFGRQQYDRARELQERWAELVQADGSTAEAANAYYNLANTLVAQEEFETAEPYYVRAAELCMDEDLNSLLALVLCNLGMTLSRLRRDEDAVSSFTIARDTFKAIGQPPGEAHVLDSMAGAHRRLGNNDEAEACWLEALSVYTGIDSEVMTQVGSGGASDIRGKLEAFYRETGQEWKIASLPGPEQ